MGRCEQRAKHAVTRRDKVILDHLQSWGTDWKCNNRNPKRNLCFVFFCCIFSPNFPKLWSKTCSPSLLEGWCCSPQADRGSCSWRARTWPGTVETHTRIDTQKKTSVNSGQGTARTLKVPVIDSLPLLRISAHAHLMEHVGRQADHGEVVNNEDGSEVDGLPVFHQAGSKPDHTEVEAEDESHGTWGVDQQPGVCPLVWNRRRDTVTEPLQGAV